MKFQFSVIVCGRFHYHHYVKYIQGNIRRVYFSHKTNESFGIDKGKRCNIFIKEYLVGLHLALFGRYFFDYFVRFYRSIWSLILRLLVKESNVALVMLHGNCVSGIKKIKANGGVVIGEAVNVHPLELDRIVSNEAARLGLVSGDMSYFIPNKLLEIELVDYIVCPSVAVKSSYIKYGFPESNICVIPYGVGEAYKAGFRSIISSHDVHAPISVICVGQVSLRKGQIRLLAAIKELKDNGFKVNVTLVGSADPDYLVVLRKFGVQFDYVSHLPHGKVKELISKSHLLALTSLEDGFGMVVTEAIEVGTPVLVSCKAGASEIVAKIGGGVVVDPDNIEEIKAGILSCANHNFPAVSSQPDSWRDYSFKLLNFIRSVSNV